MRIEDAKASNNLLAPAFDITYFEDENLSIAMKNSERMLYPPPNKEDFQDRMDYDLKKVLSQFNPELYRDYLGQELKHPLKYKHKKEVLVDPEKDSVFRMNSDMSLPDEIEVFKFNKSTYFRVAKEVCLTSLKDDVMFKK
jgi:hypothetical protein